MYFFTHCYIALFSIFFLLQGSTFCLAKEVRLIHPINFGTIILHPGGDDITIDASNGKASATINSSNSIVRNWEYGEIKFTMNPGVDISLEYPDSISLANASGQKIWLKYINNYSQQQPDSNGYATFGGTLYLPAGLKGGKYKNDTGLVITIHYD